MDSEKILIYPWQISATGKWGENGLRKLVEEDVDVIAASMLVNAHPDEICLSAITEFVLHGNVRKAAELARYFVKVNPSIKEMIGEYIPPTLGRDLLETELEDLPACGGDFPGGTVTYVS